jgi:hypothetical protein
VTIYSVAMPPVTVQFTISADLLRWRCQDDVRAGASESIRLGDVRGNKAACEARRREPGGPPAARGPSSCNFAATEKALELIVRVVRLRPIVMLPIQAMGGRGFLGRGEGSDAVQRLIAVLEPLAETPRGRPAL